MTSVLLQPLANAIISARACSDPLVWNEAARRAVALDREISSLPMAERTLIEERLYRMLPSEWPLWMESSRETQACGSFNPVAGKRRKSGRRCPAAA